MPIYNATESAGRLLEEVWATRTPAEAMVVLARPDVTVTNESDKVMQLRKLEGFDETVRTSPEIQARLAAMPTQGQGKGGAPGKLGESDGAKVRV